MGYHRVASRNLKTGSGMEFDENDIGIRIIGQGVAIDLLQEDVALLCAWFKWRDHAHLQNHRSKIMDSK